MADGTLKLNVAAPPEHGRANLAVCTLLAEHYGVPHNAVAIVGGHSSPRKTVRIDGRDR